MGGPSVTYAIRHIGDSDPNLAELTVYTATGRHAVRLSREEVERLRSQLDRIAGLPR